MKAHKLQQSAIIRELEVLHVSSTDPFCRLFCKVCTQACGVRPSSLKGHG